MIWNRRFGCRTSVLFVFFFPSSSFYTIKIQNEDSEKTEKYEEEFTVSGINLVRERMKKGHILHTILALIKDPGEGY